MRVRILELEQQLAAAAAPPPAKRQRKSTAAADTSVPDDDDAPAAPTPAQQKKEDKKHQAQIKKLFDRLKKECKAADVKFQGSAKSVKFDEVLEKAEFDALFKDRGTLVQPTPQNKPKSTVTIIDFNASQAEAFFSEGGAKLDTLKGTRWTIGGGPRFAKSEKIGACDVRIQSMSVQYSANSMKATLKFDVHEVGGGSVYGTSHKSYGFGRLGGGLFF
ncbi:hypothetical protein OH76DRAFT_1457303 [Lentinus brumalis]|uniref:Uncharacterized protein n=1 Tax=Lentinus brumalis TaxID=2498619 RepID=A0A371D164_9APHY|nr:hypothetical protein OH76DRAFT_1457303 [Polyporus brumalis]